MKLDRICKARMWSKLAQPRAADLPEPKVRPRFFLRAFGDFRCQLLIIRRRRAIAELCLLHPPKADIGTAGIYEYTALVEQDRHKSTAPLPLRVRKLVLPGRWRVGTAHAPDAPLTRLASIDGLVGLDQPVPTLSWRLP
jgi:hypothetical protein